MDKVLKEAIGLAFRSPCKSPSPQLTPGVGRDGCVPVNLAGRGRDCRSLGLTGNRFMGRTWSQKGGGRQLVWALASKHTCPAALTTITITWKK